MIRPIVLVQIRNSETDASELVCAMLDTCADKDVISEDLVKRLGLTQVTKTKTKTTQKQNQENGKKEKHTHNKKK